MSPLKPLSLFWHAPRHCWSTESMAQSLSLSMQSPHAYTLPAHARTTQLLPHPVVRSQTSPHAHFELSAFLMHPFVVSSQSSVVHAMPSLGQVTGVAGTQPVVACAPAVFGAQRSVPLQIFVSMHASSSGKL